MPNIITELPWKDAKNFQKKKVYGLAPIAKKSRKGVRLKMLTAKKWEAKYYDVFLVMKNVLKSRNRADR